MSNNINKQDHKGQTVLMMACKDANLKLVQKILELNPDVNLKNNFGQSALYYVAAGTKHNDTLFQIS